MFRLFVGVGFCKGLRLIGVAKPRYFADLIIFSLNTGLRQSNVLNLKWSQIDLDRKVAWCYPDEMKAGRALGVVLNEAAIEVLRRQIGKHSDYVFVNKRGNPIVGINSRYWKKSLELANITDFTWHDLRHTFVTVTLTGMVLLEYYFVRVLFDTIR